MLGLSLGYGIMTSEECNGCDSLDGLGIDLHVGWMLSPQLAVVLEGFGVSHTEDGGGNRTQTLTQTAGLVGAQFWITPQVWLKGALGSGHLSLTNDSGEALARSEDGGAAMIAAGFEVLQSGNFALDIQLRAGAVAYERETMSMSALTLGANWY